MLKIGYDPKVPITQARRNRTDCKKFIKSLVTYQLGIKLFKFAKNGEVEGVKYYLDSGANIHAEDDCANELNYTMH